MRHIFATPKERAWLQDADRQSETEYIKYLDYYNQYLELLRQSRISREFQKTGAKNMNAHIETIKYLFCCGPWVLIGIVLVGAIATFLFYFRGPNLPPQQPHT